MSGQTDMVFANSGKSPENFTHVASRMRSLVFGTQCGSRAFIAAQAPALTLQG